MKYVLSLRSIPAFDKLRPNGVSAHTERSQRQGLTNKSARRRRRRHLLRPPLIGARSITMKTPVKLTSLAACAG